MMMDCLSLLAGLEPTTIHRPHLTPHHHKLSLKIQGPELRLKAECQESRVCKRFYILCDCLLSPARCPGGNRGGPAAEDTAHYQD